MPRNVADTLARRHRPMSKTAAERYFRVDQVLAIFADYHNNFQLSSSGTPAVQ